MPPSQEHGVWQWNGTTWNQLNYQDPANMAAAGSSLYATFTGARCLAVDTALPGTSLIIRTPANMAAAGSSLYATFTGARCLAVERHYLEPA